MKRIKDFWNYSPLLRPLRALILAYGYVLRGEKVERPYKWSEL